MRFALIFLLFTLFSTGGALMSPAAQASAFVLTSPDVAEGQTIARPYLYGGCGGQNLSPALTWSGAPASTQSFAVTVFDPDAPTGSGWWHWLIVDLPADSTGLPRGAGHPAAGLAPAGATQRMNDYGEVGYGGPCPPVGHGPHHYVFTVYALKTRSLDLPADASAAMAGFQLNAHKLASASLTALYGR